MMKRLLMSVAVLVFSGCATTQGMRGGYGDPAVIEVLGDKFSENDLQLIAKRMAGSLAESPHFQKLETPPRIVVAKIANRSGETIDLDSLAEKVQMELFKSGRFEMLDKKARQQIAEEYEYQQSGYVQSASAKGPGNQYGADYIVTGSLSSITQESGSDKLVYYRMSMIASNLQTGVVRWAEEKEIRKKLEYQGISEAASQRLKVAGYGLSAASFVTGAGLLIAGLAHARRASFEFEHYPCTGPTGDPWECTRTVDIPARGPEPTLSWTGGGLMIGAPVLAVLTAVLVPDGNPAIGRVSWVPLREGGAVVLGGRF